MPSFNLAKSGTFRRYKPSDGAKCHNITTRSIKVKAVGNFDNLATSAQMRLCAALTPTNTDEQGESTYTDEEVKPCHVSYSASLEECFPYHFFISYIHNLNLKHIVTINCVSTLKYMVACIVAHAG